MFQQGHKSYFKTSNWKQCYQHLNYSNKTDRYNRDNDNPTQKATKFPCFLQKLNRLKNRTKTSQTTGLIKVNRIYSVSSVKERLTGDAGSDTGIDLYKVKQRMTNTLSVMANVLRNVVSKQRIRYKENGFNLDLAYIFDNIIAMGYPADNYESMYRNPLPDVYKFLEDNHHNHYKIYNLCLERSYDISKFHGRVSVYPFEDHNPPTIELILSFCKDVDDWLKADKLNVAAVHCKAGKGRTGTMICCYLVFSGKYGTAEDALACYDEKRTKDRKGVTIPSQKRYVQYFSKLIRSGLKYERRTIQFLEIRFSKATSLINQGSAHCIISELFEKVVTQLSSISIDFRKQTKCDVEHKGLPITGDVKVEIAKNSKKIFHFWFNTYFVIESSVIEGEGKSVKLVYSLLKHEIDDAHKDKSYPDDFKVDLVFAAEESSPESVNSSRTTSDYRLSTHSPTSSHQPKSFPQDSSVGSGMSSISDIKSTTSGGSSSYGVSRSIVGNGFEKTIEVTQRKSGIVNNHHINNHHMATAATAADANESVVRALSTPPPPPPAKHVTQPPSYMEYQKHQPLNPTQKQTQTANQRHLQRPSAAGGSDIVVDVGEDLPVNNHSDNMTATCQPSTNLNVNQPKNGINNGNNFSNPVSNSYNHNHSNSSSKTSSVSSHSSSSAIGDNEEDWESANPTATENNTQPKEVEVTNINTFNIISSVDVIETNTNLGTEKNVSTIATAAGAAVDVDVEPTLIDEMQQYNQQRSKQIKLDHQAQQQEEQQQSIIQNPSKESLITTNKSNNITTTNSTTTNNTTTTNNANTKKTITTQQMARSCLQSEDSSSELKCC